MQGSRLTSFEGLTLDNSTLQAMVTNIADAIGRDLNTLSWGSTTS
jgi:hypothetical protein